jgi:hypothetical protein
LGADVDFELESPEEDDEGFESDDLVSDDLASGDFDWDDPDGSDVLPAERESFR